MEIDEFVQEYSKALESGTAALFAGAGFSKSAGFVDWATLLKDVANDLGLDASKEVGDLPALAQFYVNKYKDRNKLSELIQHQFCDIKDSDENHKILAHLPIHTYWTTNYDHLIEDSLRNEVKNVDVKIKESDISANSFGADAVVYKMHGDVNYPDETILTAEEYESYSEKHPLMQTALDRDLSHNTFLFVGFSFTDVNLKKILSQLRILAARNDSSMKKHFCIMHMPEKWRTESDKDFEYRKKRESLYYEDLKRYGINIIWINDYKQITEIFQLIKKTYFQKNIFISGAVEEFGNWEKEKAEKFVYDLSGRLIGEGFRIVTGYGWGIGNYVIGGTLNEVYMKKMKRLEDELIARPFPQGDDEIKKKWPEYRADMISYTGISIFLFGNKKDKSSGKIVLSDGMKQEYDISEKQGNILIPIAATEYISRKLWKQLMTNHGDEEPYKSHKNDFDAIADENAYKDPNTLIDKIIELINKIINK